MNRLAALLLVLLLSGCAGLPMGLAVAGGVVTLVKDVIGLDVALTQDTPGKVPLKAVLP